MEAVEETGELGEVGLFWLCTPDSRATRLGRSLLVLSRTPLSLLLVFGTRGWDAGSSAFSPRPAGWRPGYLAAAPHRLLRPCLLGSISPGAVFLVSGAEPA